MNCSLLEQVCTIKSLIDVLVVAVEVLLFKSAVFKGISVEGVLEKDLEVGL